MAEYRFCFEENEQLGPVQAGGDEAAELRLARASASAALQEAEAGAVAAQHELAGLMSPAAGSPSPPPLPPADRPHVGAYHTYFNELFGAGPAPGRTRLIDRAMPLRRAAIAAHAVALQASEDALAAALEARAAGQTPCRRCVNCLDEHRRQQQEFMASVCRYNHDIADYALTVAGPGTGSEALVAMLIRTNREAIQPSTGTEPGRVVPASANEPAAQPTRAEPIPKNPPGPCGRRATDEDPPLQQPRIRSRRRPRGPRPRRKARTSRPWPRCTACSGTMTTARRLRRRRQLHRRPRLRRRQLHRQHRTPTTYESRRPIADVESTPAEAASPAVYAALAHASDAGRVKQLTLALCLGPESARRDRTGDGPGRMSSFSAVRSVAASDRLAVIGAYWIARQRAAQCQVLLEQGQWLDASMPRVLEHGAREAAAMLQLREAAWPAARPEIEANLALMEAQFALAKRMGRDGERLWPLPSSLPRADAGASNLDVPAAPAAEGPALRRWKATLPLLGREPSRPRRGHCRKRRRSGPPPRSATSRATGRSRRCCRPSGGKPRRPSPSCKR